MANAVKGLPILFNVGLFAFNQEYKNRCSPRIRKAMEELEFAMNQQDNQDHLFDNHPTEFHAIDSAIAVGPIEQDPLSDTLETSPPELPTNGETTEQLEQIQTKTSHGEEKTQTTDGTLVHDTDTDDDPFGLNETTNNPEPPADTYTCATWDAAPLSPTYTAHAPFAWPSPNTPSQFGSSEGTKVHPEPPTNNQYHSIKQKTNKMNLRYCPFCRQDIEAYINSVPYKRSRRF